jgi:type II secretory pathway pseudopilin PulG
MRHNGGFTILELAIATAICVLVLAVVYGVTSESTDTARVGTNAGTLEGQASRALDRMATELMAAGLETLEPEDPQGGSALVFRKSVGSEAGAVQWGPRQSIGLDGGKVVWVRDVDDPVQEVVLCGSVRPRAPGELPNGVDDNDNGLVDEAGLSFELSDRTLTIRLTLERPDRVAGVLSRTVTTSVRLRN